MSNINKAAVLNPLPAIVDNIVDSIPRATTSKFGVVSIGSGINIDSWGRIYLDTQEYSDRLAAIEAQAASSLATQKSEVAAAIAQVNLTQSQTITALTLEVSNLKTNLTSSITATQTDLINRADQLAQDVTDITIQLTQDKAVFTREIQDALDFLKNDASVASALRTPRKIQGVDFDGTKDINLPTFTTQTDGLVPKREGATATKYLREDGTWVVPTNTTYAFLTTANAVAGSATTANTISAKVLKDAIQYHAPTITNNAGTTGNAATASKLQTARNISLSGAVEGSTSFDGSSNVSINVTIPSAGIPNGIATLDSSGKLPTTQMPSYTSTVAGRSGDVILTKADVGLGSVANTADSSKSVASATKLTTARTINGTSFDGTTNITSANWGTARTLTIGSTGKSVNGSGNVAWSLVEMGAAAESHTHAYLPTSGGTLSGDLDVTGAITATSILSSGSITAFSDARIKGDLVEIKDSVSKVQSLTGYTYTRTDLNDGLRYVGLIAQDVQAVVPEAVREYEDGALSVDYMGLVGLLVQAIKEQDKRIKDLEEA